jgi:hypothetical protein
MHVVQVHANILINVLILIQVLVLVLKHSKYKYTIKMIKSVTSGRKIGTSAEVGWEGGG